MGKNKRDNAVQGGAQDGERQGASGAGSDLVLMVSEKVKFSASAMKRLIEFGIEFSPYDLDRIGDTIDRLWETGAKESLIYIEPVLLIVNVRGRTIITAVDSTGTKANIVTDIDSAAIL